MTESSTCFTPEPKHREVQEGFCQSTSGWQKESSKNADTLQNSVRKEGRACLPQKVSCCIILRHARHATIETFEEVSVVWYRQLLVQTGAMKEKAKSQICSRNRVMWLSASRAVPMQDIPSSMITAVFRFIFFLPAFFIRMSSMSLAPVWL